MALPAVGDIIRSTAVTFMSSQLGLNIRTWVITALSNAAADDLQMAAAFSWYFRNAYRNLLSANAEYRGFGVRIINLGATTPTVYEDDGAGAGMVGGDPLPSQTCGMITLNTGVIGRANRGRIYVPFPSVTDHEFFGEPRPTAAYVANLQTLGDLYVGTQTITNPISMDTWTLQAIIHHPIPGVDVDVVSSTVRQRWATHRTRGSYGTVNASPI